MSKELLTPNQLAKLSDQEWQALATPRHSLLCYKPSQGTETVAAVYFGTLNQCFHLEMVYDMYTPTCPLSYFLETRYVSNQTLVRQSFGIGSIKVDTDVLVSPEQFDYEVQKRGLTEKSSTTYPARRYATDGDLQIHTFKDNLFNGDLIRQATTLGPTLIDRSVYALLENETIVCFDPLGLYDECNNDSYRSMEIASTEVYHDPNNPYFTVLLFLLNLDRGRQINYYHPCTYIEPFLAEIDRAPSKAEGHSLLNLFTKTDGLCGSFLRNALWVRNIKESRLKEILIASANLNPEHSRSELVIETFAKNLYFM